MVAGVSENTFRFVVAGTKNGYKIPKFGGKTSTDELVSQLLETTKAWVIYGKKFFRSEKAFFLFIKSRD